MKLTGTTSACKWNSLKFDGQIMCETHMQCCQEKRGQIELKTYSSNAKTSIVIRKSQTTSQVSAEGRHSRLSKILEHISRLLAYFLFSLYKSNWVKLSLSSTTAHRQRAEYKSNKSTEKILSKNYFHKIQKDYIDWHTNFCYWALIFVCMGLFCQKLFARKYLEPAVSLLLIEH